MLANSITLIKENYKFLLKTMFWALLAGVYLIAFAHFLIYSRTGTQLTLLEVLVIGLQGIAFVFLYNFSNTLKTSFILSFLLWFFFFIVSDALKQVFFNNEYNLLKGITFLPAIVMTYFIPKFSRK